MFHLIGLKVIDKKYYINEDEAPAVKLMFEWIAKGKSYQQVLDEVERLGYKTRKGTKFSYSTLNAILRNEKYYGLFLYNRIGGKKKKNRVLIEHFGEVRNETAIEPIISKKLFDEVQAILDKRQNVCRPHQDANPQYVLTGLITCKHCGKSMSGYSQRGGRNKSVYRTYVCPNHSKRNGNVCDTKAINADYLETAVKILLTQSINEYIKNSKFSSAAFETLIKDRTAKIGKMNKTVIELDKSVNSFLERVINANPELAAKYEEQANERLTQIKRLKSDIQSLQAEVQSIQNLMQTYKQNSNLTADDIFYSLAVTREIFQIFIKQIIVDDKNDDIEIQFNF